MRGSSSTNPVDGLREVQWTDEAGFVWRVLLRTDQPDSDAYLGIPVGPPDLSELGFPSELERVLHQQLVARGLWTMKDVQARPQELTAALQAAYRVDFVRILEIYGGESNGTNSE